MTDVERAIRKVGEAIASAETRVELAGIAGGVQWLHERLDDAVAELGGGWTDETSGSEDS